MEKLTLDKFLSEKWSEKKKLTKKNYERFNIILLKNVLILLTQLQDLKSKQINLESKIDFLSQKNLEYTSQNQNIIQEIIKKS